MADEPDFEGSLLVEVITYTIYFGWLAVISGVALYFELPPLPEVQRAFPGPWQGTAAAIVTGVLFLLLSRRIYDAFRGANTPSPEAEPPPPTSPPPTDPPAAPSPKKRRAKKKSRRRRKRK